MEYLMNKFLIYLLITIAVYFLWSPVLGLFFPEYNSSIISETETTQAIADYLKANYKAEDFGIDTDGVNWEWKLYTIKEMDSFWEGFSFSSHQRSKPPKRDRSLLVKVKYRKEATDPWKGAKIAGKRMVLNVDETDKKRVIVTEAE
jgi:hypothetical protein